MHVLQPLLGPVPLREFFRHHFTRFPFAMPEQAKLYIEVGNDGQAMHDALGADGRALREPRVCRGPGGHRL